MMSLEYKRKTCPICSKEAIVEAIERVPGNGVLYHSIHSDGTKECEFSEFEDLPRAGIIDDPSPQIKCPECNEFGVVKAERDSDTTRPDSWNYYLSHPHGHRRCRVTREHRDIVLKATHRYIENSKRGRPYKIDHRVICPICKKEGRAGKVEDKKSHRLRLVIIHGNPKKNQRVQHYMTEWSHKEMVSKILNLSSYHRANLKAQEYKAQAHYYKEKASYYEKKFLELERWFKEIKRK